MLFALVAAVATALSAYAATGALFPGDLRIMHRLQATPGGGGIASAADVVYLARYPLMAAVAAFAAWRRRLDLVLAAALVMLALSLNPVLKDVIDRARPALSDGVTLREHASGSGYPSGHSMSIALLSGYTAVAGWQMLPRFAAALGCAIECGTILLIGWMRIYNGAHWPSDVLGGWTIGLALLWICLSVASRVAARGTTAAAGRRR